MPVLAADAIAEAAAKRFWRRSGSHSQSSRTNAFKLSGGRHAIQAGGLCAGILRVSNVMSEFEIELVSKLGVSVIGAASDAHHRRDVCAIVIKGLATGGLYLTKEGRTVLAALLGQDYE